MSLTNHFLKFSILTQQGNSIHFNVNYDNHFRYNHRLPRLANLVLDVALSLVVDPERFEIVKEKLARDYANTMRYDQPFHICLYELAIAMEAKRWHVAGMFVLR